MKSIGEVYFNGEFFSDYASKTVLQPLVGKDMMQLVINRRNAKGRLTPEGQTILDGIVKKVGSLYEGKKVIAVWDQYCGCSQCPCSPGYRIKVDTSFSSREETRFNLWINEGGKFQYHSPTESYQLGYDRDEKLKKYFTK